MLGRYNLVYLFLLTALLKFLLKIINIVMLE